MLERLLERGKTSGREDDNAESIKKRFRRVDLHVMLLIPLVLMMACILSGTFIETSMPVVDHYRKEGKVIDVGRRRSKMASSRALLTKNGA